jgi:hypothetical protein
MPSWQGALDQNSPFHWTARTLAQAFCRWRSQESGRGSEFAFLLRIYNELDIDINLVYFFARNASGGNEQERA